MFSLLKNLLAPKESAPAPTSAPVAGDMRDVLFGDLPLVRWTGDGQDEPWSQFARVQTLLRAGDKIGAIAVLRDVAGADGLEARHTLQAWHFLRELGEKPDAPLAKEVLGVVVEVGLPEGLDVLAAYRDHSARYWNWSGKGVVWERPDARMDASIDALLQAGATVVAHIGPWEGARPAAVVAPMARLNFLTPSGLHFGQAAMNDLMRDPLAAPAFEAAAGLMQQLTALAVP